MLFHAWKYGYSLTQHVLRVLSLECPFLAPSRQYCFIIFSILSVLYIFIRLPGLLTYYKSLYLLHYFLLKCELHSGNRKILFILFQPQIMLKMKYTDSKLYFLIELMNSQIQICPLCRHKKFVNNRFLLRTKYFGNILKFYM